MIQSGSNNLKRRPENGVAGAPWVNEIVDYLNKGGTVPDFGVGGRYLLQSLDVQFIALQQFSGQDGNRLTPPTYKYDVRLPYSGAPLLRHDVAPLWDRPNGRFTPAKWGLFSYHYDPDKKGGTLLYAHEIPGTTAACPHPT